MDEQLKRYSEFDPEYPDLIFQPLCYTDPFRADNTGQSLRLRGPNRRSRRIPERIHQALEELIEAGERFTKSDVAFRADTDPVVFKWHRDLLLLVDSAIAERGRVGGKAS